MAVRQRIYSLFNFLDHVEDVIVYVLFEGLCLEVSLGGTSANSKLPDMLLPSNSKGANIFHVTLKCLIFNILVLFAIVNISV